MSVSLCGRSQLGVVDTCLRRECFHLKRTANDTHACCILYRYIRRYTLSSSCHSNDATCDGVEAIHKTQMKAKLSANHVRKDDAACSFNSLASNSLFSRHLRMRIKRLSSVCISLSLSISDFTDFIAIGKDWKIHLGVQYFLSSRYHCSAYKLLTYSVFLFGQKSEYLCICTLPNQIKLYMQTRGRISLLPFVCCCLQK